MRRTMGIRGIGVATAVLSLVSAGWATGQAPPPSPKVQAALAELDRAATFQQVAEALKRASLSPTEQNQLLGALPKPVEQKIERLFREARLASKARLAQGVKLSAQRLEFHKRELELRLASGGAQAQNAVQTFLAHAHALAPTQPKWKLAVAAPRPAPATSGSVASVTPSPAVVGQSITITGDGFGASGQVWAILGERERYECRVTSWSPTRVAATVAVEVEPLVREGSRRGYVQVRQAGSAGGPWAEVTFAADPARLTPEITGVTPDPIVDTYDEFVIQGRNFLEARPGTLTVRYPEGSRGSDTLRVKEWTDTYLVVSDMPLSCASQRLTFTVRNHLGREGTATFRYEPAPRRELVQASPREKHCELWADGHPSVFCLVGQKETVAVRVRCNCGTSRVLEVGFDDLDSGGISSGRAWKTQPRADRFEGSYEVWAEAYSWIEVRPWFVVEVPRVHECHNDAP